MSATFVCVFFAAQARRVRGTFENIYFFPLIYLREEDIYMKGLACNLWILSLGFPSPMSIAPCGGKNRSLCPKCIYRWCLIKLFGG